MFFKKIKNKISSIIAAGMAITMLVAPAVSAGAASTTSNADLGISQDWRYVTVGSFKASGSASGLSVSIPKDKYVYTGKAVKPKTTVKYKSKKLKKGKDYTISYASNKGIGMGTVTVKFKGEYAKSKAVVSAAFVIIPKKPSITSVKATSNSITVKWKKVKGDEYYVNCWQGNKIVAKEHIKGSSKTSSTFKNLQKKTKYTISVVAGKSNLFSDPKSKSVKTKSK